MTAAEFLHALELQRAHPSCEICGETLRQDQAERRWWHLGDNEDHDSLVAADLLAFEFAGQ